MGGGDELRAARGGGRRRAGTDLVRAVRLVQPDPSAVAAGPDHALRPVSSLRRSLELEWAALAPAVMAGAVDGAGAPGAGAQDIFVTQAIVDALYASAACGREVDVDLSALETAS